MENWSISTGIAKTIRADFFFFAGFDLFDSPARGPIPLGRDRGQLRRLPFAAFGNRARVGEFIEKDRGLSRAHAIIEAMAKNAVECRQRDLRRHPGPARARESPAQRHESKRRRAAIVNINRVGSN